MTVLFRSHQRPQDHYETGTTHNAATTRCCDDCEILPCPGGSHRRGHTHGAESSGMGRAAGKGLSVLMFTASAAALKSAYAVCFPVSVV